MVKSRTHFWLDNRTSHVETVWSTVSWSLIGWRTWSKVHSDHLVPLSEGSPVVSLESHGAGWTELACWGQYTSRESRSCQVRSVILCWIQLCQLWNPTMLLSLQAQKNPMILLLKQTWLVPTPAHFCNPIQSLAHLEWSSHWVLNCYFLHITLNWGETVHHPFDPRGGLPIIQWL